MNYAPTSTDLNFNLPPHGFVNYVDHLGSDLGIVTAARLSYGGQSKGEEADKKLLMSLYRRRHTSPFEQASITYHIRLPIFVMRQLVRHRTARLNEFSARYKEMPERFYLPKIWRKQDTEEKQATYAPVDDDTLQRLVTGKVEEVYEFAYEAYRSMLENGICREQARLVLPLGIYTEITWNMDLHNLMGVFRQRLDSHAQQEIREVVEPMAAIACHLFPWCMQAFTRFGFTITDKQDCNVAK